MIVRLIALGLIASCFLLGQTAGERKPASRARANVPIEQPIPFSHRIHAGSGMKCLECHAGAAGKEQASFPETGKCMACHIAIQRESPYIKALAAAHASKQRIHWVRVYKLPDFVFFSHSSHAKPGVSCEACHGPVEKRDVLAQERAIDMDSCMKCHSAAGASRECALCHQLGH
jgi:hypothetical protein